MNGTISVALQRLALSSAVIGLVLILPLPVGAVQTGVRTSRADEFQPAAGEGYIAWVQNTPRRPNQRIVYAKGDAGPRFRVSARGAGFWPGIDGTNLVYQQTSRRLTRSDLKLFDLTTRRRSNPPRGVNTGRWEYWPDVSGDWLVYAQSWNRFRNRRVLLFNLATREVRVLATSGARRVLLTPGQVNGDYVVWDRASFRRDGAVQSCDVFVYEISARTTTKIPNPRPCQYAPSVTDAGTVYFGRSGRVCGSSVRLVSYPLGGPATVEVAFRRGIDFGRTYAFTDPEGNHVYYDRARCDRREGRNASDVYKIIDA